ncbi:anti-sigma factor family protein [Acuticoccus kandeliae]|uniref:anti-sigma factor family protein n=1 Tax=Acuticoccus kandeliae TaxID=2073160 RepID=UPI0013002CF6|nr:anti-sigma factor [Acuticoccus kandeliae]
MTPSDDPGIEADLHAYLNGQIDPERAFALADYLAADPERAAAVLADVRATEGLRLALGEAATPPPGPVLAEARRLEGRLTRRRLARRAMPYAAAVALFLAGWASGAMLSAAPAPSASLVEAALDAEAALDLRHWMASQPESLVLDPQEITAALGIDLPNLLPDWIVRDVQIVATPDRPGVAIVLDTPDLGRIMLFSVAKFGAEPETLPDAFQYEGRTVAVFDHGRSAYVVVDNSGHPDQLSRSVGELVSRFN